MERPDRWILKVGDVFLKGKDSRFAASPIDKMRLKPGEPVEIGVAYRYEEPTLAKDSTKLRFDVDVPGLGTSSTSLEIGDAPASAGAEAGFVFCPMTPKKAGVWKGTYTLDVDYSSQSWVRQNPKAKSNLKQTGQFQLTVE